MNPIYYINGEVPHIGDIVTFARQKGKITLIGDDLREWGLKKEEIEEGRVMIEFENGSLLCTDAASEDLQLITPANDKPT